VGSAQAITWDDHKSRNIVRSITWNDKKGRVVGAMLVAFAGTLSASTVNVALHPAPHLLSVIVRAQSGEQDAAAHLVTNVGGTVVSRIGLIDGLVASVPAESLSTLATSPSVADVTSDTHLQLLGTAYGPTTDVDSLYNVEGMDGARAYWNAGYTGQGVDVALIDSGVAQVNGLTTPGKVVNGPDLSFESQNSSLRHVDTFGHGTHMAGIIAGRDDALSSVSSNDSTHFLGMAPGAHIVSLKVADAHGQTDVSQMLAAIDWVVQHRTDNGLNIRVLNLSFGTDSGQSYQLDPLAFAAEQAWKHGIVVVVSAGNSGNRSNRLDDPAVDPYVIAVAADDTNSTTNVGAHSPATFTSRGDGTRNPDLSAPGVHIASLRAPSSSIDEQFGGIADVATRFFRGSGTSQAAAIVSGAAALVISQRPSITPDQLKALLVSKARSIRGNTKLSGKGELNLASVLNAATPHAAQAWSAATGRGTLEGARGSDHVVNAYGAQLNGERDIFGNALNTSQLAGAEQNQSAWSRGFFNGAKWAGEDWSGSSWTGASWSGSRWPRDWSGRAWSSGSWSTGSWSDCSWSTGSWSTGSWSTGSWSTGSWSTGSWSTGSWSTGSWSTGSWSAESWS
jgi:serine protease AprX